jgi:hypothetical protein
MTHASQTVFAVAVASLFWLAGLDEAHAYLDPGAGSFILQILIGSIAGGVVVLKLYWIRARNYLFGITPQQSGSEVSDREEK